LEKQTVASQVSITDGMLNIVLYGVKIVDDERFSENIGKFIMNNFGYAFLKCYRSNDPKPEPVPPPSACNTTIPSNLSHFSTLNLILCIHSSKNF
jgi:hypothetical protein